MSHPRLHRLLVVSAALAAMFGVIRPAVARGLRIKRVAFAGVRTAPLAALRQAVAGILPQGRLSAARRRLVAGLVQARLQRTLRGLGYFRAAVRVTERQPGSHTSFVVLRARVREGSRFRIGALDVTGVSPAVAAQHRLGGHGAGRSRPRLRPGHGRADPAPAPASA
jgi:hypothetical protein